MIVQRDVHFHHARHTARARATRGRPGYAAAMRFSARALGVVALISLAGGCRRSEPSGGPAYGQGYGQYPPPGQYQGGYPPPAGYQPPPPGYPPAPTGTTPAAPPPTAPPPAFPGLPGLPTIPGLPGLPGADPINAVDVNWLRQESGNVMSELIGALSATAQARVKDIPYFADTTVGEVNAFAGCDEQGMPLMAISDGLLEVEAHIAQFKATDELFGTRKVEQYEQLLAQQQRPGQPIVRPPAGFIDPAQHVDARKLARQHQILQEQLAFVLGHELAHHHLGHTGCANGQGGSRGVADFGRVLSRALPMFNQPNEMAADVAGVNNLMTAGSRRQAYRWTEGGAVLTIQFFAALDQLTPATIVFGFERTHPHPIIRLPIVQSTANTWRMTGGAPFGIPGLFGG